MHYMGGKFKIRKALGELINKNVEGYDYYEPFVGAAWVLGEVKAENRYASDANPWLITMWKALQDGWVPPETVTEGEYKWYKENQPLDDPMTAFCGFGCSFAGKWFGGYARCKRGDDYVRNARNSLLKHLPYIASATFAFANYADLKPTDTLVYCDPPYKNTTGYGATSLFDHDEFWEVMREWSKSNTVLVSEYTAPEDFVCVKEFQSKTGLRNKAQEQEVRSEKVFAHESIAWEIVC
jgi:DNA adenine methylase